VSRIVILGGGPAGYEAALVGASLGAQVTVIDADGLGGACVLTDCVPSKTLIAVADAMTSAAASSSLGVRPWGDATPVQDASRDKQASPQPAPPRGLKAARSHSPRARGSRPSVGEANDRMGPGVPHPQVADGPRVDAAQVHARVKALAHAQSADIESRLRKEGVTVVRGHGRLAGPHAVEVDTGESFVGDVVLIATGARPRVLPTAVPDRERILDWRHLYDLDEIPEHLVVVGSGVTGAEFASAYRALGSAVTLVSSREHVLPGEDPDAARVVEEVFVRRGVDVLRTSRAAAVRRDGGGVVVDLTDGRRVFGSHALMAVGSLPRTGGLGLRDVGVRLSSSGHVEVDRMSRTSVPGVYAAGDCTGVRLLASVAAMQGRIAMWHALGEAVTPLRLGTVASNVFTDPEIATVGVTQRMKDSGAIVADVTTVPLGRNPRAKMLGITDGFVKLFCRPGSGSVLGGVVVAPRASELILPVTLAVEHGLTVGRLPTRFRSTRRCPAPSPRRPACCAPATCSPPSAKPSPPTVNVCRAERKVTGILVVTPSPRSRF
jgi:dihydrolipoamide dehydrogenase